MTYHVKIDSYDHEGRGIAHLDGKVIFIPNALLNELVEIEILEEKKNYSIGKIINIEKTSSNRIKPLCPYYDNCGGCNYEHISYKNELNIKKDNFINIINKYANLEVLPTIIKTDNYYNYRNKVELKIKNNKFGYYNSNSHKFITINNCLLAKESINQIIENAKLFNVKEGNITIRSNYQDEILIKIDTKNKCNIDIDSLLKDNKIVGIILNDKTIYGANYFYEKVNNYLFKVNINSFFQINLGVLEKIFEILEKEKSKVVVDLYCGVGTLGMPINKDKLYGIEVVKEAVIDAKSNAYLNKQNNNEYILGDSSIISNINEKIDTIIIDPPRSGLNNETLDNILKIYPNKLIYMSCNPITLARDLKLLSNEYKIKDSYLLEMFPRTKHMESICVLERK